MKEVFFRVEPYWFLIVEKSDSLELFIRSTDSEVALFDSQISDFLGKFFSICYEPDKSRFCKPSIKEGFIDNRRPFVLHQDSSKIIFRHRSILQIADKLHSLICMDCASYDCIWSLKKEVL